MQNPLQINVKAAANTLARRHQPPRETWPSISHCHKVGAGGFSALRRTPTAVWYGHHWWSLHLADYRGRSGHLGFIFVVVLGIPTPGSSGHPHPTAGSNGGCATHSQDGRREKDPFPLDWGLLKRDISPCNYITQNKKPRARTQRN